MEPKRVTLTPPQKDMILLERHRPGSTNVKLTVDAPGVSLAQVEKATRDLVARHDVLRSRVIRASSEVEVSQDCSPELLVATNSEELVENLNREIRTDLTSPNLRVVLEENDQRVHLVVPHAFVDGVSISILHTQLHASFDDELGRSKSDFGFSDYADAIRRSYDEPASSVIDFWGEHLDGVAVVTKDDVEQPRDAGYVDIPLGNPSELTAVQRKLKTSSFALMLSLFAHGLQRSFNLSNIPCRTVFIGRRSRPEMGVVGPFAELPLLRLDAGEEPIDRTIPRAIRRLFLDLQPRKPLLDRLAPSSRHATRRFFFFRDTRRLQFDEDSRLFHAENPHLFQAELLGGNSTQRSALGGELIFSRVNDVSLFGAEYPVRGETLQRADGVIVLRLLAAQVAPARLLEAASAVLFRFSEMHAD